MQFKYRGDSDLFICHWTQHWSINTVFLDPLHIYWTTNANYLTTASNFHFKTYIFHCKFIYWFSIDFILAGKSWETNKTNPLRNKEKKNLKILSIRTHYLLQPTQIHVIFCITSRTTHTSLSPYTFLMSNYKQMTVTNVKNMQDIIWSMWSWTDCTC